MVVEMDQEQATLWWSWRFYQNFLGLLLVVQFGEFVGNIADRKWSVVVAIVWAVVMVREGGWLTLVSLVVMVAQVFHVQFGMSRIGREMKERQARMLF